MMIADLFLRYFFFFFLFRCSVKQLFETADYMYILPYYRVTVYLMGVMLGYVCSKYKTMQLTEVSAVQSRDVLFEAHLRLRSDSGYCLSDSDSGKLRTTSSAQNWSRSESSGIFKSPTPGNSGQLCTTPDDSGRLRTT